MLWLHHPDGSPPNRDVLRHYKQRNSDPMRNTAGLRLWVYVAFAACILAFMFAPRSWPAWSRGLLWAPGFVAAIAYMWLERAENRRAREGATKWLARYNGLVDAHDVPDDGHLYEYLDADEWERVFALVERMPPGARSLRRAIKEVDPSFEF